MRTDKVTLTCSDCRKKKDQTEFYKHHKNTNRCFCKKCSRIRVKKWNAKHPWYIHYKSARSRCTYKYSLAYSDYGGRGILCLLTPEDVKEIWVRDEAWNMLKPSLDRIDPEGNYSSENCQFLEFIDNVRKQRRR